MRHHEEKWQKNQPAPDDYAEIQPRVDLTHVVEACVAGLRTDGSVYGELNVRTILDHYTSSPPEPVIADAVTEQLGEGNAEEPEFPTPSV
ncbi:hypothetical protein AMS68_004577 [Peltaster fructicola]|uniref:Uncharacterized protein n=1 Tax=Peltaster fructicola TaxID=286661 RepID=A0A6H0XXA4_9PEZI|nr:hypothetical protein AMS68_004577 [Peltaster fructicola]